MDRIISYHLLRHLSVVYFGKIYSGLGEVTLALEWLEKSYSDHEINQMNNRLGSTPSFYSICAL